MNGNGLTCTLTCWAIAALAGLLAAVLLWVLGDWSFMQGAFIGVLVLLVGGFFLTWTMCGTLSRPGEIGAATKPAAQPAVAAAPRPAPAPAAEPTPAPETAAPAPEPVPEPEPEPAPAVSASGASAGEAVRPQSLSAPRDEGADDLKMIKGVGPKLEKLLHSMGFYHFDQIAAWTSAEVAWVDDNLEGFKGRVTRDKWQEQAKLLAAGGETEFSKRVDKGEVY